MFSDRMRSSSVPIDLLCISIYLRLGNVSVSMVEDKQLEQGPRVLWWETGRLARTRTQGSVVGDR